MSVHRGFQIGPCECINIGDHLWIGRYLLARVAEDLKIILNLSPKQLAGDWNATGWHTNFSNKTMEAEDEVKAIYEAIE